MTKDEKDSMFADVGAIELDKLDATRDRLRQRCRDANGQLVGEVGQVPGTVAEAAAATLRNVVAQIERNEVALCVVITVHHYDKATDEMPCLAELLTNRLQLDDIRTLVETRGAEQAGVMVRRLMESVIRTALDRVIRELTDSNGSEPTQ